MTVNTTVANAALNPIIHTQIIRTMKSIILSSIVTLLVGLHCVATDNGKRYENFNLGGSRKGLILLPNAETGSTQILFVAAKETKATLKVYDATGKLVLQQEEQLAPGKNKINIENFGELAEGNYNITLTAANKVYATSFMVWK